MITHAKFHTLLAQMPGVDKETIVSQYEPSGSLSVLLKKDHRAYAKMLSDMELAINGHLYDEGDTWRKRVIRAIGQHFTAAGRYTTLEYRERLNKIKSTACRIAGVRKFNDIPIEKLRKIYNEFKHKHT